MSDRLRSFMEERIQAAIATEINAAGGAMLLAASSICTASKTFVCQELTENAIYLYTYGDGVPAAVSFLRGEDGSVSATASFLLDESFPADDPEAWKPISRRWALRWKNWPPRNILAASRIRSWQQPPFWGGCQAVEKWLAPLFRGFHSSLRLRRGQGAMQGNPATQGFLRI